MRPGVEVTSRAARPTRGEPTNSGTWFVVDFAESGPEDEAVLVSSLDDFDDIYGGRVAYSMLYDALETFFAEGGAEAFVARQVGPAPVRASVSLNDRAGAPVPTLRIDALYVGDYANGADGGLSVQVIDGTPADSFTIIVNQDGDEVERFADLLTPAAAVTALDASEYVRAVDLGSASVAPANNPAVIGATNLAGGTDDHTNATDAEFDAALALFTDDLGAGQLSAPGRGTTAVHLALIAHASSLNRTAYLDAPDLASKAALVALAGAVDHVAGSAYAGLFGTWLTIPGVAIGTTRAVPGSAYAAGVTNRVDRLAGTSGAAPAGEVSTAQFAIDVRSPGFTDADYEDLNDAGINMARSWRNRGVQLYGFRSVTNDPDWTQLTANRLRVSLTARLSAAAFRFPFRTIDGRGHLLGEFAGEMTGICLEDWQAGALFGTTPEEAFRVNVGAPINTPETAAAGEINAEVHGRFSQFAELVRLALIKVPVTSRL